MRQCPLCSRAFDDAVQFCPHDGRVLLLPDPFLGKVIDGKYRIDALLGGGGHSTVYRATHVHLNRTTAFKVVRGDLVTDPRATGRFRREARAIAQIKHPHIVTIHDFGIDGSAGVYLVMEFLEGRTLRHELRRRSRLSVDEAIAIGRQIAVAAHAAHEAGVIHRDIKPDNVFLELRPDVESSVKLLDFGVALLRGAARPELGESGSWGTPAYMAPEQWRGEPLDARSDVYAIGCILYEMIAGRPPFLFDGASMLDAKHLDEQPLPPSTHAGRTPERIDEIALRALAKERDERFATAAELDLALEAATLPSGARSQPVVAALPQRARAARAIGNLEQPVTSFVGRENEIAEVARSLESSRLVTITGPGGGGKTRLALKVAEAVADEYPDGVWLVQLAPLADPLLVAHAVADTLGVPAPAGASRSDALVDFLQAKRLLLVLDNCEHLVEACAELAESLLRACPLVRILASSQEPLGILGEASYTLPPLALPAEGDRVPASLLRSEAVRLFVERARLSNPHFALTSENAAHVASVCRRLDGIPLAIELAAARTKMLSVGQIDSRLNDRFRLLTSGSRTAEPRQRTLQAAIDWSYDLLDDQARTVFARLSVFAGGFTLEAAEAIAAGGEVAADDVLVLLAYLVDKSLVIVDEGARAARYRMLQTIRYYGAERLRESGEAPAVRTRHRDHFLEFAEEAERELRGAEQSVWLERIETEHDNLRAALEWSQTDAATSDALLRLAAALWEFWLVRGHAREGRQWLDAALAASAKTYDVARARALHGAGTLARVLGDYDRAIALHTESLELWRRQGEPARIASALNHLGIVLHWKGEYERAREHHEEALALAREAAHPWETALALKNLGIVAHFTGDLDLARERLEESVRISRSLDDTWEIASALNNLAVVAASQKDYARSAELLEEVLALNRALGERRGLAMTLNNLGALAQYQGDYERAADLLKESLALNLELGDKRLTAYVLECFGSLLVEQGYPDQALRIAGATESLRAAIASPLAPAERAEMEAWVAKARAEVGDARAERAQTAGREMTLQRTIDYVFSVPTLAG